MHDGISPNKQPTCHAPFYHKNGKRVPPSDVKSTTMRHPSSLAFGTLCFCFFKKLNLLFLLFVCLCFCCGRWEQHRDQLQQKSQTCGLIVAWWRSINHFSFKSACVVATGEYLMLQARLWKVIPLILLLLQLAPVYKKFYWIALSSKLPVLFIHY